MPDNNFSFIAFGDIHDSVENLERIPELATVDGLVVTGDLTNVGGVAEAKRVLDALAAHKPVLAAQIGNMDKQAVSGYLDELGINIHARARLLAPGLALMGAGGSTPTPFATPSEFSEDAYAQWLEQAWAEARAQAEQIVLVSHNPPRNTACDIVGPGLHVGSQAVRDFIEKYQPPLCICGHIHEARAVDVLGNSRIVNPGNFSAGAYVVVNFMQNKLSADLRIL